MQLGLTTGGIFDVRRVRFDYCRVSYLQETSSSSIHLGSILRNVAPDSLQELSKMSRRRSTDPTTAISITLPRTLLDEIDSKLTRNDSRSAWIARACMNELVDDEINVPTRQLMAALYARIDDETLKTVLLDRLTS
jgi:hypothetical protein